MSASNRFRLVTLGGECLDIEFQGKVVSNSREGAVLHFHLTDLTKNRGPLRISVFCSDLLAVDLRLSERALLNAIRRAFDSNVVSFDSPPDGSNYQEISLEPSDFATPDGKNDGEVRSYIIKKGIFLVLPIPGAPSRRYVTNRIR